MAGSKRTYDSMTNPEAAAGSSYTIMFESFRSELDEHHDRRERVLKASKDITQQSKKVIFAVQRAKEVGQPISDNKIKADVSKPSNIIKDTFAAVSTDLTGVNAYRYQRNISGGIQEFLEAVLFQHYIETHTIMSWTEVEKIMPAGVMLTYEDYLLGLFDTTGEIMRWSVTYLANHVGGTGTPSILADMQTLRNELELLNPSGSPVLYKDFESKMKVTRASVEKVENGVYSLIVRGKERPPGWKPDVSAPREADQIESY